MFDGELLLDAGNCPVRLIQAPSPHTDDTNLVYVEEEKFLFIGDSNCGEFPSGVKDREKCKALADVITSINPGMYPEGHWPFQIHRAE